MDEDWDDEQLAALDAAEAAVSSSSSSSSRNDNDIASPQDIRDALQRAQSALATMRARNHAGASGRWCRCDTAAPSLASKPSTHRSRPSPRRSRPSALPASASARTCRLHFWLASSLLTCVRSLVRYAWYPIPAAQLSVSACSRVGGPEGATERCFKLPKPQRKESTEFEFQITTGG